MCSLKTNVNLIKLKKYIKEDKEHIKLFVDSLIFFILVL